MSSYLDVLQDKKKLIQNFKYHETMPINYVDFSLKCILLYVSWAGRYSKLYEIDYDHSAR